MYGTELSDSMVRSVHMILHQAMDAAVKERLIVKNPTSGTKIPKANHKEKQILTEAQLDAFMEVIKQDELWYDSFYTELTTGLRLGEICGLKWQDFDESNGKLRITRTIHQKKGGGLIAGDTKTTTGTRTILLPPSTAELLKERKNKSLTEWIFPNPIKPEQPTHPQSAYNRMKTLLKYADLPSIRFHDLRHTFASLLIGKDVPIINVSNFLGHSDISTTANIYAHLDKASKQSSADIISDIFKEDK